MPKLDQTGTPRWVKVLGSLALLLAVLLVVAMLAGGGQHGPGRHAPSDGAGGHAAPAGLR
jgi:predicted small lipoprotein YifL